MKILTFLFICMATVIAGMFFVVHKMEANSTPDTTTDSYFYTQNRKYKVKLLEDNKEVNTKYSRENYNPGDTVSVFFISSPKSARKYNDLWIIDPRNEKKEQVIKVTDYLVMTYKIGVIQ